MQLFVPVILQYCRSCSLISRFRLSLRSISKLLPLSDPGKKKERKKKAVLFFFFLVGRNIYCYWIYTFLSMSDTRQNSTTLLFKCFLRSCKYIYLYINMYTSTLSTSVMYVDALLLLLRFITICLLHQLMPLSSSCKNIQWFVYQRDVSKEHCCTDVMLIYL